MAPRPRFRPAPWGKTLLLRSPSRPSRAFALPDGKAGILGVQVGATTVSGKQLAKTAQPYTVQAQYTDAQLSGRRHSGSGLAAAHGLGRRGLQPLQGGVDVQNKIVTATTNLLQPLALVGVKQNGGGDNGGQNGGKKVYWPRQQVMQQMRKTPMSPGP